jgi:hypothetical protein
MFISATRVWSAINKHKVTEQRIIPDVAGLNCANVCLSVRPSHAKKSIVCRRTFHQHTCSTLVLSKGRTISASRQVLEQIQRGSLVLCAKLNYSQCPALGEQKSLQLQSDVWNRRYCTVSAMRTGIGAYEWTREERSELERKSQFCAWCADIAANIRVYISVDARICRSADDEEITRKEDLHDLLTHILRTHSTAL